MSAAQSGAHVTTQTSSSNHEQPSIFDVLAQENLMSGLQPALGHLVKFVSGYYPRHLSTIAAHYDECYLGFDFALQNYYLNKYGASFAENFYGMKRVLLKDGCTEMDRWTRYKSLLFLVFVPYARKKCDKLYNQLKEELDNQADAPGTSAQSLVVTDRSVVGSFSAETSAERRSSNPSMRARLAQAFVQAYPTIQAAIEIWSLLLQIGYLLSRTSVHSPWLLLAGVQLANLTPQDYARLGQNNVPPWPSEQGLLAKLIFLVRAFPRVVLAALSRLMGVGLFFLQFLDWWYSSEHVQSPNKLVAPPVPKAPQLVCREDQVLQFDPKTCPICRAKRRNDTVLSVSGYVFCYSCIARHLHQHKHCPVTKLPATHAQLVRLFNGTTNYTQNVPVSSG